MQVKNLLPRVGVAVDDRPVAAFGYAGFFGDARQDGHHVPQQPGVVRAHGVHGGNVLDRNDKDVLWRGGVYVAEGDASGIAVDDVGANLPGRYFTEDTIHHGNLLSGRCVACGGRKDQEGRWPVVRLWLALLAVVVVSVGCATARPRNDLPSIVHDYHHDLRWQYFRRAAGKVDPRFAKKFLQSLQDSEDSIHVTDWEIRDIEFAPGGKKATVRVRLRYFRMPSTVLEDSTVLQRWAETKAGWRLVRQDEQPFAFPPDDVGSGRQREADGDAAGGRAQGSSHR